MEKKKQVLVSRQPIFDRQKSVFAYELQFEETVQFSGINSPTKKSKIVSPPIVVDSVFINGLKNLTSGKRAIIGFDGRMLVQQFPLLFPSDLLGVEVQTHLQPKPGIKKAAQEKVKKSVEVIKNAGYLVVVSDWLFNLGDISLVKLADIVGVDFRSQGIQKRFSLNEEPHLRPRFLARSVETYTDYSVASDAGYNYFQGDFFNRADLVAVRSIPSYKINFMRIMKEINKPGMDADQLERILKKDVSITYKLLRLVNSASFGLKTTVHSIRHALTLLGEREVKKWLSLIVLSAVGTDKPHELVTTTIIRATFCESLAKDLNYKKLDPSDFFLLGMFSTVDAFLDRPMQEIMEDLPLAPGVIDALLGKLNPFKNVLDLVMAIEKGDWEKVTPAMDQMKLDNQQVSDLYLEAIEWGKCL